MKRTRLALTILIAATVGLSGYVIANSVGGGDGDTVPGMITNLDGELVPSPAPTGRVMDLDDVLGRDWSAAPAAPAVSSSPAAPTTVTAPRPVARTTVAPRITTAPQAPAAAAAPAPVQEQLPEEVIGRQIDVDGMTCVIVNVDGEWECPVAVDDDPESHDPRPTVDDDPEAHELGEQLDEERLGAARCENPTEVIVSINPDVCGKP